METEQAGRVRRDPGVRFDLELKEIRRGESLEGWYTADCRREWESLIAASDNINAVYQSSGWFEHLYRMMVAGERLSLVVARDHRGEAAGFITLRVGCTSLDFQVSGRTLGGVPLERAFIMGGQPLLPPDTALHDRLFEVLDSAFPDCSCLELAGVPSASFVWEYLNRSSLISSRFLVYPVDGFRPYHVLHLPATFREFGSHFSSKKRYNLKRQIRLLGGHEGAGLDLQVIESKGQVPALLATVTAEGGERWKHQELKPSSEAVRRYHDIYTDLAEHGMLLSYILCHGGRPIASIWGKRFGNVFLAESTSYDKSMAAFSPGTALFYLAMQDLIEKRGIRVVNFGFGAPAYRMSNAVDHYASVILFRKTVPNRLIRASHSAFRSSASRVGRWIRNRSASAKLRGSDRDAA